MNTGVYALPVQVKMNIFLLRIKQEQYFSDSQQKKTTLEEDEDGYSGKPILQWYTAFTAISFLAKNAFLGTLTFHSHMRQKDCIYI